jgi:hypothetical protein
MAASWTYSNAKRRPCDYAPSSHGAIDYARVCEWVLANTAVAEPTLRPESGAPVAA